MRGRAAVFAGQGAQFVGMGKDLAEGYPACRALFERADEVLGYGISKLCFEGPAEKLTRSDRCQPAIFVTSLACWQALAAERADVSFSAAAGLSLGEWTALHVAGALTFEDTLRVLAARGRFMQEACEERDGGMVSVIGLSAEALNRICEAAGVETANLNSEQQTVLSGDRARIVEAERLAREAGARRTVVLRVAGAFHSSLMTPAADRLAATLADVPIRRPGLPVAANVTGKWHGGPEEIRDAMVKQVTSPVRWMACVQKLRAVGVGEYVECGPGRVLTGLIKRIDTEAALHNIQDRPTLQKTVADLK